MKRARLDKESANYKNSLNSQSLITALSAPKNTYFTPLRNDHSLSKGKINDILRFIQSHPQQGRVWGKTWTKLVTTLESLI